MKKKILLVSIVSLLFGVSCHVNSSSQFTSSESSSSASYSSSSEEVASSESISSENHISSSEEVVFKKYTVTWKNDDGEILEVDNEVNEGSIPSYDGLTPSKESNGNISYKFSGWTPTLSEVTCDITYTATYLEIDDSNWVEGVNPVLSSDGKSIEYGFYPQSVVSDENVITELNKLTVSINSWYEYQGEYYTKVKASVYNNEGYKFDNGTSITNGKDYFFKCEPIKWSVLKVEGGNYFLLSSVLLDAHNYYNNYDERTINEVNISSNNYQHSSIREWLNFDFYNLAFGLSKDYIIQANVDNSASTTNMDDNKYICENTMDKVYLPSYQDYINTSYGFDNDVSNTSSTRACKTTDYSRTVGAWSNETKDLLNNGTYWTRSPSSEFYYTSWVVNSSGYLSNYAVDGTSHCVRPCITISLS